MEADFKDGPLKTFNGDLKVTKDGAKTKFGEVMAEIVQGMGDKKASNGIIHVIDKVLLEGTKSKYLLFTVNMLVMHNTVQMFLFYKVYVKIHCRHVNHIQRNMLQS